MIDVHEGQFCVVQKYGGYRVIRADKVTTRQIRTRRYADKYDVEKRDDILFAGTEQEANDLRAKASDVRWSVDAEIEEARLRFRAAIEPFEEVFTAQREEAGKKGQLTLADLFSPRAASGMEARRAAAENTDAVHDSPTAAGRDAQ